MSAKRLFPHCLLAILTLLLAVAWETDLTEAAEFFVAPSGSDSNPGTKEQPLASLQAASKAIRELKKSNGLPDGVTVWLRGGDYQLSQGFRLTAEDSGTAMAPIVYRAFPGERVRLLGGRKVIDWKAVTDAGVLNRLDEKARGKVVQANIRALGVTNFGQLRTRSSGKENCPTHLELFFDGEAQTIARWPNKGQWDLIAGVPKEAEQSDGHQGIVGKSEAGFHYAGDQPKRWMNLDGIWTYGFWSWDWADSYERVGSIDQEKRLIKHGGTPREYSFRKGQRFYYLNILEELDQPGEWFLDPKSGTLYFWPPKPIEAGEAMVSVLEKPLVSLNDASYVTIRGLQLLGGRDHGFHLQGGESCNVAGCWIRLVGNYGVLIQGGHDHHVLGCDIENTGEGGVKMTGGDRRTLTPGNHSVENCSFRKQGQWCKTYVPAIEMDGVGLRALHNEVSDHPHCAIQFLGNEMHVEFNNIHHIALETGDVGAIYTGRDYTFRGNVIRHNFVHDTGGVGIGSSGAYMDDCVSGTEIVGNVFQKTMMAVFLGGGRDHHVENNIFIDCDPAVSMDGRGLSKKPVWHDMVYTTMKERLMEVPQVLYRSRYPVIQDLDKYYAKNDGVPPENNVVMHNICVGGRWLELDRRVSEKLNQIRDNYVGPDPGFVSLEKRDFRLKKDAPAAKIGFREIPFDQIGLRNDEFRKDGQVEAKQ